MLSHTHTYTHTHTHTHIHAHISYNYVLDAVLASYFNQINSMTLICFNVVIQFTNFVILQHMTTHLTFFFFILDCLQDQYIIFTLTTFTVYQYYYFLKDRTYDSE